MVLTAHACQGETLSEQTQDGPVREGPTESTGPSVTPIRATSSPDLRPIVLFLGTSLTAGYGLPDTSLGFPEILGARMGAEGLDYQVVNAGVTGDTSAGGLARLSGLLEPAPAILVVELGANDGLRGQPPGNVAGNLRAVIAQAQEADSSITVVLVGMEAPPNLGSSYTTAFREVFTQIAVETGVAHIPFLLAGIAGDPDLNQADGIHPTARGHELAADNLWSVLKPVLMGRCKVDQAC